MIVSFSQGLVSFVSARICGFDALEFEEWLSIEDSRQVHRVSRDTHSSPTHAQNPTNILNRYYLRAAAAAAAAAAARDLSGCATAETQHPIWQLFDRSFPTKSLRRCPLSAFPTRRLLILSKIERERDSSREPIYAHKPNEENSQRSRSDADPGGPLGAVRGGLRPNDRETMCKTFRNIATLGSFPVVHPRKDFGDGSNKSRARVLWRIHNTLNKSKAQNTSLNHSHNTTFKFAQNGLRAAQGETRMSSLRVLQSRPQHSHLHLSLTLSRLEKLVSSSRESSLKTNLI